MKINKLALFSSAVVLGFPIISLAMSPKVSADTNNIQATSTTNLKSSKLNLQSPQEASHNLHVSKITFNQSTDGGGVPDPFGQITATIYNSSGREIDNVTVWKADLIFDGMQPELGEIDNIDIPISSSEDPASVVFHFDVYDDDGPFNPDDTLALGSSDHLPLSGSHTQQGEDEDSYVTVSYSLE